MLGQRDWERKTDTMTDNRHPKAERRIRGSSKDMVAALREVDAEIRARLKCLQ